MKAEAEDRQGGVACGKRQTECVMTAPSVAPPSLFCVYSRVVCVVSCRVGCTVSCRVGCTVNCRVGCAVSCRVGCTVSCRVGCTVS